MTIALEINPPLTCQFKQKCQRPGQRALAWTNEITPTRWVVMPVCDECFPAALVAYGHTSSTPIFPNSPNYVKSRPKNVETV